ncbi:MAG: ribonuclease D [Alphaproteobacteria bacterium]|nr:ribonuclease D [Alphaproteobacteria bacterium]
MTITLHENDLPAAVDFGRVVAIDTETMGLNPYRDRLCLVQLSAGDGNCHIVRFGQQGGAGADFAAPHLRRLLTDPGVTKLFHFARFDVAVLHRFLGVWTAPVYCTKVASKLTRTFTDRHGLKDLCKELLGVDLSKQMQSSDWGAPELSPAQLDYAAQDVLHLHRIKDIFDSLLAREDRRELAAACFAFLPARAHLDLIGWQEHEIFEH